MWSAYAICFEEQNLLETQMCTWTVATLLKFWCWRTMTAVAGTSRYTGASYAMYYVSDLTVGHIHDRRKNAPHKSNISWLELTDLIDFLSFFVRLL